MSIGPRTSTISVIVPTLNEAERLPATLAGLVRPGVEMVVADGGSTDETLACARALGARVVACPAGRALQMNAGARVARGEIFLFLHADTKLPADFDRQARQILAQPGTSGGAFRLGIDRPGYRLGLIALLANGRSRCFQLPYGDQALFLSAALFRELGGYAELPILEDVELVRRLRGRGRIRLSSRVAVTSARRWQRFGVARTTLWNLFIILAYLLGVAPQRLQHWYRLGEKG